MRQRTTSTSADVADELWAAICYFAEVPDAGIELLKSRGIQGPSLDDAFLSFQSFLRQARAFFYAARGASWRSSPMIYYYAFLNLAKALIVTKWPEKVRHRVSHGLSHQLKDGGLEVQTLTVQREGVFPLLYEFLFGEKMVEGLSFEILSLLAYCTDVADEIVNVKKSRFRTLPGKSRFEVNAREAYATLAIGSFENFEDCVEAKEHFYKTFEEVELPNEHRREEFGFLAEEASGWRYFETIEAVMRSEGDKVDPVVKVHRQCSAALGSYLLEYPYTGEALDFLLCRPIACPKPIFFNEILGIYSVLFFLSSLVRYYPRYFEGALVTKDVWMIDVFVRSAPMTLLRYLANRLFGENRQYAPR
jgi:hypothetical protein